MADRTTIEWSDATWNPIAGCTLMSEGCRYCYAKDIAARFHTSEAFADTAIYVDRPGGTREARWTGAIKVREHLMDLPLTWKKPRRIFVNSVSDLFHDAVPDEVIDRVFAIMALCPLHMFQILTKRPERMRQYLNGDWSVRIYGRINGDPRGSVSAGWLAGEYPLPNVWLGTSVENQASADARRADLAALAGLGWNTFVSYEPALGFVTWDGWEFLKWFISGGESGPHARPTHPDWHRAAMRFCGSHCIPYLFKQWGEFEVAVDRDRDDPDWRLDYSNKFADRLPTKWLNLAGGCGFHGERFHVMRRVGKARAGRYLDGMEHNGMPEARDGRA